MVPFILAMVCGCLGAKESDSASEWPPDLPLPERYTACTTHSDCVTIYLGKCFAEFPVYVNCDSIEEVFCRYREPRGGTFGCDGHIWEDDEPWDLCIDGTCGRGASPPDPLVFARCKDEARELEDVCD